MKAESGAEFNTKAKQKNTPVHFVKTLGLMKHVASAISHM